MNTTTETMHHPGRLTAFRWMAGSSAMAAIVSLAVIALAIVGLAGELSAPLAAIATIVVGAAILIEGGAWEAGALSFQTAAGQTRQAALKEMPSAEALGGIAGIVLGILALLGVAPATLLSVAVLVFGGTLLLSGSAFPERAWAAGPADGRFLLGLSVTVLGLLAVIGIAQLSLILVGLLVLGVAGLFGGSAKTARAVEEMPR
jgi:hypothetical protein